MHVEAYEGFGRMLQQTGVNPLENWRILDVGGADVNGSVRGYFPNSMIQGVDIGAAPGVDFVFDASDPEPWAQIGPYDLVIATELFEHCEPWRAVIANMAKSLDVAGPQIFIATCASTGRPPHGARGEWGVPAGQFYGNVSPQELDDVLATHFHDHFVDYNPNPGDAYMWAHGAR